MDGEVVIEIPVSPATAEALRDPGRARAIGRLIDGMVNRDKATDALRAVIAETKAAARAGGLTDAEIDAELDAYNAERRS